MAATSNLSAALMPGGPLPIVDDNSKHVSNRVEDDDDETAWGSYARLPRSSNPLSATDLLPPRSPL